jgi:valyl-tRNA synthetase
VWGIPIPAWFKDGVAKASIESPGEGWVQDPDTFDTWFSSGQWPVFVTEQSEKKNSPYYPTQVMETGHDLIFKWVPRMVIFGLYLTGKAPFSTVYMHGLVNDANGKKMSKSKGNVVNPLDLTDKYGTDALRMTLVVGNTPGTDLALQENKVKGYKNFANKIWNATRFVLEQTKDMDVNNLPAYDEEDSLSNQELNNLIKEITKEMDEFKFYIVAEKLYHYFWHTFADVLIERSKKKIQENRNADSARALLYTELTTLLRLLHPFMPFITEEIWQSIGNERLLLIERWPHDDK